MLSPSRPVLFSPTIKSASSATLDFLASAALRVFSKPGFADHILVAAARKITSFVTRDPNVTPSRACHSMGDTTLNRHLFPDCRSRVFIRCSIFRARDLSHSLFSRLPLSRALQRGRRVRGENGEELGELLAAAENPRCLLRAGSSLVNNSL